MMNRKNLFQSSRWPVLAGGILLTFLLLINAQAFSTSDEQTVQPGTPGASLTTDQQVTLLEGESAKAPRSLPLRNRLAWAYIQKGRETGDAAYFTRAERLLEKSLAKEASNGEALGLRAWVALFKHEFKEAAIWAEKAHAAQPKISFHDGVLSDAYLELGDYPKAIDHAQQMLDLKPDQGALSRAAHLRSLHGDPEGAIDLWEKAIRSSSLHSENTAWCQVELGDEYFNLGKVKKAEGVYQAALKRFPNYHRALAGLGRLRATEDKKPEAARLYQQAIEVIPYPHYLSALGDLYTEMGKPDEARKQYDLVEQMARLDQINQVLYNRDLALFYADHDRKVEEAVRIAARELEVRKDVYTYDILGWTYYKDRRYPEAEQAMKKALRLGTRDPRMLFHAGMIARAVGKEKEAKRLLNQALSLNPHFHPVYAQRARQALAALGQTQGGPS
ncbi:MAG: tetratricopeptide repeat protein [Nitrospirae bacterium]|nr:tetratricopeptide repeat protein [Candidatus Manganitrophaceae bacterium]